MHPIEAVAVSPGGACCDAHAPLRRPRRTPCARNPTPDVGRARHDLKQVRGQMHRERKQWKIQDRNWRSRGGGGSARGRGVGWRRWVVVGGSGVPSRRAGVTTNFGSEEPAAANCRVAERSTSMTSRARSEFSGALTTRRGSTQSLVIVGSRRPDYSSSLPRNRVDHRVRLTDWPSGPADRSAVRPTRRLPRSVLDAARRATLQDRCGLSVRRGTTDRSDSMWVL